MIDASERGAPAQIGRYRIVRRLASGTNSEVLLAAAEGPFGFERAVIIKRMLPGRTDDFSARILAREAVAYARLNHPAVVRLYDFFAEGDEVALVLEYVNGIALDELLARLRSRNERFDDVAAFFIASRIFAALAAAHEARDPLSGEFAPVIHRNLTPSNVLVPWDGFVKLVDFGVAKVSGVTGDSRAGSIRSPYGYMAPEQVAGEAVTVRTDIYQANLIFYELLTGVPAFRTEGKGELELLQAMAAARMTPLHELRPDLPVAIADAMRRGLEGHPDARTITAGEMAEILRATVPLDRGRAALAEKLAGFSAPPLDWPAQSQTISRSKDTLPNLQAQPSVRPGSLPGETIRPAAAMSAETVRPPAGTFPDDVLDAVEIPAAPEGWSIPSPPPWLAPAPQTDDDATIATTTSAPTAQAVAEPPVVYAPPPAGHANPYPNAQGTVTSRPPPTTGTTQPAARFHTRPPRATSPWLLAGLGVLMGGAAIVIAFIGMRWVSAHRGAALAPAASSVQALASAPSPSAEAAAPSAAVASNQDGSDPAGTNPPAASAPAANAAATSAAAAAAPAATMGRIVMPAAAVGHRVFIDGRVAGSGGEPREVRCGKHSVRIGSRGPSVPVDVPCGGEVAVPVAPGAGTK